MKINSNTVSLDRDDYSKLEETIKKIASENGIDSVQEVKIKMDSEKGSIVFKKSEETSSEDK